MRDVALSRKYVTMQRRKMEKGLDYYPTPPWAVRAFLDAFGRASGVFPLDTIWEPAAGECHMVKAIREMGVCNRVLASDVVDYGCNDFTMDFFDCEYDGNVDAIMTNPPFAKADAFIRRSLELYNDRVVFQAFLVRLAFLEGVRRYETIYSRWKPYVWVFSPRVTMKRGELMRKGSSVAFMWLVFLGERYDGNDLDQINFIPRDLKERYEYDTDYEN